MQPKEKNMIGHNLEIPKEMGAWVLNDPDNIEIKKSQFQNQKRMRFY